MSSSRLTLKAEARTQTGKNANRKLRASGITPAVFYSSTGSNLPVQVKEAEILKLYATVGRTTLFTLEINNNGKTETCPCLVWDVEYYPTRKAFQHVDFFGVDLNREIKIRVPLVFEGVAKGTKLGGKLEVYREQIYVTSKAETLPSEVKVDISGLDINQGLRVADLIMPQGVRALYDDNFAILTVNAPGAKDKDSDEADK